MKTRNEAITKENKTMADNFQFPIPNEVLEPYIQQAVSTAIVGALDITTEGGVDDITLIKDAIENDFDFDSIEDEVCVFFRMKETGEWEDVFWHKYYVIDSYEAHEYR